MCFHGENVLCQQELHQRYHLKQTFYLNEALQSCGGALKKCARHKQEWAAASPVFLTTETWLTPDGWSNTDPLSLNPHGCSSLYPSLHRWMCRPCYWNTPPLNIYKSLYHQNVSMFSVKGNCSWVFQNYASVFTITCHGLSCNVTQHVLCPSIHSDSDVLKWEAFS